MSSVKRTNQTRYLLLILLPFMAYVNVFFSDFTVLDDHHYILENPHVNSGLNWENVLWALSAFHISNWHPLTWMSHMLDVQLFGMHAPGHHLTNLVLHIANTLLLFRLMLMLKLDGARSFIVALFFSLHPLHVESVAWIAERKDVLCATFWILGIIAYVSYVGPGRKLISYIMTLLLLSASLLSKQMSVTFPLVVLLLDFWPLKRFEKRSDLWKLVLEKVPIAAVAIAGAACAYLAQRAGGAVMASEVFGLWDRAYITVYGYTQYLWKTVWPVGLGPLYVLNEGAESIPYFVMGLLLLLLVSLACIKTYRTRPYLLFGWLWFLGTLVPVIGIVKLGLQSMADRYTYIPLVGPFIAMVWLAADLLEWRSVSKTISTYTAIIAVSACMVLTFVQTGHWLNSLTLFQRALDLNPKNYTALFGYGAYYHYARDYPNAATFYERGLEIKPNVARIQAYLGFIYEQLEDYEGSVAAYDAFLDMTAPSRESAIYYYYRGRSHDRLGRGEAARRDYETALKLNPELSQAREQLTGH